MRPTMYDQMTGALAAITGSVANLTLHPDPRPARGAWTGGWVEQW